MEKQEWSIRDIDPNNEILLHGGKWSEEAKRRVSEARRAGRSVLEMFGDLYKKTEKTVSSATKSASNMVKPTAKAVSKTASNLVRVAKKTVFQNGSKTTTGVLGTKSGDKALKAYGLKKRKTDWKVVKKVQDKLDKQYGQGKYKKSESQKLDEVRGKAMDKREKRKKAQAKAAKEKMRKTDQARGKAMDEREKRIKTRKKSEESVAKIKRNETKKAIKAKEKSEKNRSRDAIGENTREKFRNGDMKAGNAALIRKYKSKMENHMKKSPDERRKNYKEYDKWNKRVKELEEENKKIASRNKGSNLEENNARAMENMDEANKTASESARRRNNSRMKDLEAENEAYYMQEKRKKRGKRSNNIKQSATFDYQAVLISVQENQNELHHYGVQGMKWGRRKAKVVSYGRNYARNMYNTVRHPIYHDKAVLASKSHSRAGQGISVSTKIGLPLQINAYGHNIPVSATVGANFPTHTALNYRNNVVKKLVDSKRKMNKKDRYSIKNRLSKEYRLGESKRVEAAIRSTPYRVQGISYMG